MWYESPSTFDHSNRRSSSSLSTNSIFTSTACVSRINLLLFRMSNKNESIGISRLWIFLWKSSVRIILMKKNQKAFTHVHKKSFVSVIDVVPVVEVVAASSSSSSLEELRVKVEVENVEFVEEQWVSILEEGFRSSNEHWLCVVFLRYVYDVLYVIHRSNYNHNNHNNISISAWFDQSTDELAKWKLRKTDLTKVTTYSKNGRMTIYVDSDIIILTFFFFMKFE